MNFGAVSSISTVYLNELRRIYTDGIRELGQGKTSKNGMNGYCEGAIPAYVIAVAAWEASFYESILADACLLLNPKSAVHDIGLDMIDRWSVEDRTVIVPKLLFGQTFDTSAQPFQDFSKLVSIRNDVVHFKLKFEPGKSKGAIKDLVQRGILMTYAPKASPETAVVWTHVISTTEGVRWAIATIVRMMHVLASFVPSDQREQVMWLESNFKEIDDKQARQVFIKQEVDPDSKYPP